MQKMTKIIYCSYIVRTLFVLASLSIEQGTNKGTDLVWIIDYWLTAEIIFSLRLAASTLRI